MAEQRVTVRTHDDRQLEVLLDGDPDGVPFVFHSGTPSAAVGLPALVEIAARRGLRLITYSRPGYGESSPDPGRTVADVTDDVYLILHRLGLEQFVTLGWSGGGPHALACLSLLPGQCLAAATLAGVAPRNAEGLDWPAGMGEENIEEFSAAAEGEAALSAWLTEAAKPLGNISADQVAEGFGDLVSDVDKASLTGEFSSWLAASLRRSQLQGIEGWRDDDLAFVRPWGFDVAAPGGPVSIWQGAQDRMVPFAHGQWLAAHIPGARVHLYEDEGHLSLVSQLDRIVDDLMTLAAQP